MSASYDTLLRLAALTRSAVDDDLRELDRALDTLDDADMTLLFFALATLKGRAFQLSVPAPERYAELREFAEHIGATFEEVEGGQAIFRPPAAQERRASRARRRLTSRVKSKSKSRLGSPLGIGLARPVHPRIWKRIHIQKPSGVHTKIFLAGRPEGFAIRPPKDHSCPLCAKSGHSALQKKR